MSKNIWDKSDLEHIGFRERKLMTVSKEVPLQNTSKELIMLQIYSYDQSTELKLFIGQKISNTLAA